MHLGNRSGHAEVVRLLLARGADITARCTIGMTALMEACSYGHLAASMVLIGAGADKALLDNAGNAALSYAKVRVRLDDEEPDEGEKAPTDAQRKEHKTLVRVLQALEAEDAEDDEDE